MPDALLFRMYCSLKPRPLMWLQRTTYFRATGASGAGGRADIGFSPAGAGLDDAALVRWQCDDWEKGLSVVYPAPRPPP